MAPALCAAAFSAAPAPAAIRATIARAPTSVDFFMDFLLFG